MRPRGFTLIELLMVVAIIGLLSTVVLGSLKTAQQKASDSKVIQQARELRTIMELERNETGVYTGIKSGGAWKAAGATCSSGFTGNYATKAQQICTALVAATGNNCGASCVYFLNVTGVPTSNPDQRPNYFTITAYLPSRNTYLCLGSSGRSSMTATYLSPDWTNDGCYADP